MASSSAWELSEGAQVRLVTTGMPDAEGQLAGALEIALKPGWKTYWRDPGDAGVPPSLSMAPSSAFGVAALDFPAPERFDDGSTKWAGYKHAVTFPVTFSGGAGGTSAIEADIFLGICETICIPLQARLSVDAASDPDNLEDAAIVKAALEALPGPEQPDFGVTRVDGPAGTLVFEAALPGEPEGVDLFIATPEGYVLGTPERADADAKVRFSVTVFDAPAERPAAGTMHYTLVTSAGAVTGELPLP